MTIAMVDLFGLGFISPDLLASKTLWAYVFCTLWYAAFPGSAAIDRSFVYTDVANIISGSTDTCA